MAFVNDLRTLQSTAMTTQLNSIRAEANRQVNPIKAQCRELARLGESRYALNITKASIEAAISKPVTEAMAEEYIRSLVDYFRTEGLHAVGTASGTSINLVFRWG
jgi:hypothetical protein